VPQSEFRVRETGHLSIAQLAEATNATFADYFVPITHTTDGFASFCRGNSIDLAHSLLLERKTDGRLVGLTMLAMRGAHGWCGGLGLVPEFRGHGLASVLVDALVDQSRRQRLVALRLEVLTQNARAIQAYARAGFRTERELVILAGAFQTDVDPNGAGLEVCPAESPLVAWTASLGLPVPAPCWQREAVSLLTTNGMQGLIATRVGQTVGALLYRPNPASGLFSIGHLAATDEGVARALIARAAADTPSTQIFVQNEPEGSPLHALSRTLGLRELHRQHEMSLTL
jgi:ribosomal protein S18 acetylase RimI-like enzyme